MSTERLSFISEDEAFGTGDFNAEVMNCTEGYCGDWISRMRRKFMLKNAGQIVHHESSYYLFHIGITARNGEYRKLCVKIDYYDNLAPTIDSSFEPCFTISIMDEIEKITGFEQTKNEIERLIVNYST